MNIRTGSLIAATALALGQLTSATAAAATTTTVFSIGDPQDPGPAPFLEQSTNPRDTTFVCSEPGPSGWIGTVGDFVVGVTPENAFPALLASSNASNSTYDYWSCSNIDIVFNAEASVDGATLSLWRMGGEETEVLIDGLSVGRQMPEPFEDPHPTDRFDVELGTLDAGQHVLTIRGTEQPVGSNGYFYFSALLVQGRSSSAPAVTAQPVGTTPLGSMTSVQATVTDPDGLEGATCVVDFGDGITTTVAVADSICTAEYVYPAPGDHLITVTGVDGSGLTTSVSVLATVYDPESSVVANGRIDGGVLNVSVRHDDAGTQVGRVALRENPKGAVLESDTVTLILVSSATARVEGVGTFDGKDGHDFVATFDLEANTVQVVVIAADGTAAYDSGARTLNRGATRVSGG